VSVNAISSARSGITAAVAQIAASSHNLANLDTKKPTSGKAFQGERVVLEEVPEGGVRIAGLAPAGTEEGVVVPEPTHPDADGAGNVRAPDIDIAGEMVNALMAERMVEANVTTIKRAFNSYRDLLAITDQQRSVLASA
jgi:flagellar basal-body rod protein FlgC